MYPRKVYEKLSIPILALALCLAGGGTPAAAQRIDDDDLLVRAERSAEDEDWLAVSKYLFAYISREPRAMRDDPALGRALYQELTNAEQNLQIAMEQTVAGSGGDKGLPPPLVSVDIPRPEASRPGARRRSARKSYRLVCRGGGEMFFNYYPQEGRRTVRVHFLKAEWSGSEPALNPGTCSWLDRPINDEEPFWLALDLPSSEAGIGRLWSDAGESASELDDLRVRIRQIEGTELRWLLGNIVSPERFIVWCYNDGRFLRITDVVAKR